MLAPPAAASAARRPSDPTESDSDGSSVTGTGGGSDRSGSHGHRDGARLSAGPGRLRPLCDSKVISRALLRFVADCNWLLLVCRPLLSGANQCELFATPQRERHKHRILDSPLRALEPLRLPGPWVTRPSPKAVRRPRGFSNSGEPSRFQFFQSDMREITERKVTAPSWCGQRRCLKLLG